ncbi:hypothetical protein K1719_044056 [Acacia pycnantha]|nr:hypothetical protein K1719_044056 [Acacia pycnantha]
MASINIFSATSHRSPELSASVRTSQYPIGYYPRRRPRSVSFAGDSSEIPTEKPEIELEFIGPKLGSDGSYPVEKAKAISGEKLLRNIMLDNKIELYATYGKVMNCGGGGSCGTCIVEITDGADLLNERTNTELRYLKKKPESWRLACQTIVGNKENSGKVVVQRIPQWKKLFVLEIQRYLYLKVPRASTTLSDILVTTRAMPTARWSAKCLKELFGGAGARAFCWDPLQVFELFLTSRFRSSLHQYINVLSLSLSRSLCLSHRSSFHFIRSLTHCFFLLLLSFFIGARTCRHRRSRAPNNLA